MSLSTPINLVDLSASQVRVMVKHRKIRKSSRGYVNLRKFLMVSKDSLLDPVALCLSESMNNIVIR